MLITSTNPVLLYFYLDGDLEEVCFLFVILLPPLPISTGRGEIHPWLLVHYEDNRDLVLLLPFYNAWTGSEILCFLLVCYRIILRL